MCIPESCTEKFGLSCKVKNFTFSLCSLVFLNFWLHLFPVPYDYVSVFYCYLLCNCISCFCGCHFFQEWVTASFSPLFNSLWRRCLPAPSNSFVKSLSAHVLHARLSDSSPALSHCCFLEPLPPAPVCAVFTRPEAQLSLWECLYLSPLFPKFTASSFLVYSFVWAGHIP